MKPDLTVIVPTFRRPQLLRRVLRSITSQAHEGFEIVVRVYDNASGDETEAVVRTSGTRDVPVEYVGRPTNVGIARNFAGAIRDVRSEFFAVISDDDVLLPGSLARNMESLAAHPEAVAWNGVVLSGSKARLSGMRPAPQWPRGVTEGLVALDLISRNIRPETTGMVFRTCIVDAEFCQEDDAFMAQDLLWLCSAARQGGIGLSPSPSAILYTHPQSLSSGGHAKQVVDILFPSIPRLCELVGGWPIPYAVRERVIRQIQQSYGVHGLLIVLYRAALAGDAEGLQSVAQVAQSHRWMSPVLEHANWSRAASPLRIRLALLAEQLRYGNPRHKLKVYCWSVLHWPRYRESLPD